ncbi:hypothetical protein AAVH_28285 [Aphelenchoides avenae]|nr:hypothetical protein AAVH_28285 [Aphelenchus avenae]
MTAICDYRHHLSSVSDSPCYSEPTTALGYAKAAHHKRPKAKSGLTVRKVMKKLLANRFGRLLRAKDVKPCEDSEQADGFRQRTLSENSNPASILSDYDPMPTISEESEDEVVAYFFELMQSGGCYWEDDDYEFDGRQ